MYDRQCCIIEGRWSKTNRVLEKSGEATNIPRGGLTVFWRNSDSQVISKHAEFFSFYICRIEQFLTKFGNTLFVICHPHFRLPHLTLLSIENFNQVFFNQFSEKPVLLLFNTTVLLLSFLSSLYTNKEENLRFESENYYIKY